MEALAGGLDATLLGALAAAPRRLAEFGDAGLVAPQATVRAHLKGLAGHGLALARDREGSPQTREWAPTETGRELLVVARALGRWLSLSPAGALAPGGDTGKMAVRALVGGWSSGTLSLLAAGPLA